MFPTVLNGMKTFLDFLQNVNFLSGLEIKFPDFSLALKRIFFLLTISWPVATLFIQRDELSWVKRRTYHELNLLSLVRLMWSSTFDLGPKETTKQKKDWEITKNKINKSDNNWGTLRQILSQKCGKLVTFSNALSRSSFFNTFIHAVEIENQ